MSGESPQLCESKSDSTSAFPLVIVFARKSFLAYNLNVRWQTVFQDFLESSAGKTQGLADSPACPGWTRSEATAG
jgi:hypothetical protein